MPNPFTPGHTWSSCQGTKFPSFSATFKFLRDEPLGKPQRFNGTLRELAMRLVGMNGMKVIPHHLRTLGERLRYRRRQMGWTQEQLAVQAGTNQAVIQKIENGKSLRPRKLDEIAAVLDVNPAWLMFGDEKATPLTDEAREVAEMWMALSEGERERVRSEMRLLASRRMSS